MSASAIRTVVVTSVIHPHVRALLAERFEVIANDRPEPWPRAEFIARARTANAILAFMLDEIDEEVLAAAPGLKIVAGALKGYDNFDVAACSRRGVWLTIVTKALTAPTAELAIGLAIGLIRKIASGDRLVRAGSFAGWRPILYGATLTGAVVGIIGMGAVGRAIAQRLVGFETTTLYYDVAPLAAGEEARLACRFEPLDDLVARSDLVILALPLTPATRHLIDERRLAMSRPKGFLVNIARGSLVCERAVAAALAAGTLAGYAADVFELEDWALANRPREIEPRLLQLPDRTLFTPHLGSAVAPVRQAIECEAAFAIIDVADGRVPRGAVNWPAHTA
jgi:phosphonate dehydrogenase